MSLTASRSIAMKCNFQYSCFSEYCRSLAGANSYLQVSEAAVTKELRGSSKWHMRISSVLTQPRSGTKASGSCRIRTRLNRIGIYIKMSDRSKLETSMMLGLHSSSVQDTSFDSQSIDHT